LTFFAVFLLFKEDPLEKGGKIMIVREELISVLEKEIYKKTKKEIEEEIRSCQKLHKFFSLISNPSSWERIFERAIKVSVGNEVYCFWQSFSLEEKAEIIAYFVALELMKPLIRFALPFPTYLLFDLLKLKKKRASFLLFKDLPIKISFLLGVLISRLMEMEKISQRAVERLRKGKGRKEDKMRLAKKFLEVLDEKGIEFDSLEETIDYLEASLFSKIRLLSLFSEFYLKKFKERIEKIKESFPDPKEFPCQRAIELVIKMREEKRKPQSWEEVIAEDHFKIGCFKNEACLILSQLYSIEEDFTKVSLFEEDFKKVKEIFKEMRKK